MTWGFGTRVRPFYRLYSIGDIFRIFITLNQTTPSTFRLPPPTSQEITAVVHTPQWSPGGALGMIVPRLHLPIVHARWMIHGLHLIYRVHRPARQWRPEGPVSARQETQPRPPEPQGGRSTCRSGENSDSQTKKHQQGAILRRKCEGLEV